MHENIKIVKQMTSGMLLNDDCLNFFFTFTSYVGQYSLWLYNVSFLKTLQVNFIAVDIMT